jgi:hypothetical protein
MAEQHTFPTEAAAYDELVHRGQVVASFLPISGQSSGPIVRVVHLPHDEAAITTD